MLIHMNVCDHCGTQKQIVSGSFCGVSVVFDIDDIYKDVENTSRYRKGVNVKSFCDKECFVSYLQENLNSKGFMKYKEVEEDDIPF